MCSYKIDYTFYNKYYIFNSKAKLMSHIYIFHYKINFNDIEISAILIFICNRILSNK